MHTTHHTPSTDNTPRDITSAHGEAAASPTTAGAAAPAPTRAAALDGGAAASATGAAASATAAASSPTGAAALGTESGAAASRGAKVDQHGEVVEQCSSPPIASFDDMGLSEDLLRGIYSRGFEKPSAIQQRAIMPILKGRDTIAQAQS